MLQSTRKELAKKLLSLHEEFERCVTLADWDAAEELRKQIKHISDALTLEDEQ